MASATPDPQLPSQLQSITGSGLVPNYTAWRQWHKGVNNLPRVVTQPLPDQESNLQSLDYSLHYYAILLLKLTCS